MTEPNREKVRIFSTQLSFLRALLSGREDRYMKAVLLLSSIPDGAYAQLDDNPMKYAQEFIQNIFFVDDIHQWPSWMKSGTGDAAVWGT